VSVTGPDRSNEPLDWFLYREGVFNDRFAAGVEIESGKVIINGKQVKDATYKPKKGDHFVVRNGLISFVVAV
jgi:ribosomal 50S subunit-recycling heat shock protein